MLRCCLALFVIQDVLSQEVQLQKIADAYSKWASSSPYRPQQQNNAQVSPIRQFTHYVTVQAPPQRNHQDPNAKPIVSPPQQQALVPRNPIPINPVIEPKTSILFPRDFIKPTPVMRTNTEGPRYSQITQFKTPSYSSIRAPLSQISAQRLVRPQYHPNPMHFYHPRSSVQQSPVGLPTTLNASFLIPQRNYGMEKTTISEDLDEARALAGKKQRWGRQHFEFTCEFGFCGGGCCQPPPQPTQIHAAAMPGSLTHPLVLMLHPSPPSPQCSPACQPMCQPQCLARLQYMPLPMPEFFQPQQPMCRSDCMPSCHVDCLIMPPLVIRCTSFPCHCNAGYRQCSPFTCCSSYTNMRAKFRSMVEDKSSEDDEKQRKKHRMYTPVHIPYHGTPGTIEGNVTVPTTTEGPSSLPKATPSTTSTSTTTITTAPTTTTTLPTTTTTRPPPPPTTTTTSTLPTTTTTWTTTAPTTTTTPMPITPIYPDNVIPLVPVYELWRPKEKIQNAKEEEEIENFIRSNSFVEMLAELAQVKAKEDLNKTADDFIRYITETGK